MRRLPQFTTLALVALLAGLVLLATDAQACDDQYPSCLRPVQQNVQEQADDSPAADVADTAVHAVATRRHRKSYREAEQRPARRPATAPSRTETTAHDPAPASIATLPWWQPDPTLKQTDAEKTTVQAAAGAWMALAPRNSEAPIPSAAPSEMADSTADPVADANEVNELDLAAADVPEPPDTSWLNGLLAVLGGALAAGSAARLLLV